MSDQDGKKTLGLSGGARNGRVNQSFSRGRTKSVVVETKRQRVVVPKPGSSGGGAGGEAVKRPSGVSDAEMERRLKALQAAKSREAEEAENRAREEREREEERERRRAEIEQARRERAWQAQADGGPGLRIASNRAAERNGERGGQRGTGDPASYRGSGRDAARAASADARASDGRPETGGYAARDPYAAGGGNTASDFGTADAGWPRGAVQSWRLDRRKRVRLNEIHYLDHPRIGALIRVREL